MMAIIYPENCRQEILMLIFGEIQGWIVAQRVVST